jgi:hypothetical protein
LFTRGRRRVEQRQHPEPIVVGVVDWPGTVIAINIGGRLTPFVGQAVRGNGLEVLVSSGGHGFVGRFLPGERGSDCLLANLK